MHEKNFEEIYNSIDEIYEASEYSGWTNIADNITEKVDNLRNKIIGGETDKSPKYYIVELLEDVKQGVLCKRNYNKGVRVMVWEQKEINTFWVVNSDDCFNIDNAKNFMNLLELKLMNKLYKWRK